jgi:hypothetical protein
VGEEAAGRRLMRRARRDFVAEGLIEVGPGAEYFAFFDGEMLGKVFSQYAGAEPTSGEYTKLGRARITVEWLEDDEATEDASPT